MNWQEIIALSIVAVTAAILLWSKFRPRQFSFERDTHCGCSAPSTPQRSSILVSGKKGEAPRVTVKMK